MPVDKQVIQRHKILDKLFRSSEGYTYDEIICELEDRGLYVAERTIKEDKKIFQQQYGAVFADGLKRGRQVLLRYEDTDTSVFATQLSDKEKGVIAKLVDRLQIHNDIPQYQWMLYLLDGFQGIDESSDLGASIEFENNLDLEGLDIFKPLMEACMGHYVISFAYAPYSKAGSSKNYKVSPYMLKQYNNRWFLLCRCIGFSVMSTFPIDRIVPDSVKKVPDENYMEVDWNYLGDCLEHTVGVTSLFDKNKRVNLLLSVSSTRFKYIMSKPILRWQRELEERSTEDRKVLLVEDITYNKELISLLLSFGSDVEVLEPSDLREEIASIVKAMANKY